MQCPKPLHFNPRLRRGFTLIETIVATGVLVVGLVTIASLFTSAIKVNRTNRQKTTASLLLVDKMEQFRVAAISSSDWTVGGSLSADTPEPGYFDSISSSSDGYSYLRLWQIGGTAPKTVTVIVYANQLALTGRRIELARATTSMGPTF